MALFAVDDYLAKNDDGNYHVQFRPLVEKFPTAILTGCVGILLAGFPCEKVGLSTRIMPRRLAGAWNEYTFLDAAKDPWSRENRADSENG
ncbi:hypothetical protein OKW50_008243 [Paraburkholderia youngii]|uniref:hypothetical protein n=1 Tax=Paraburkholderia youngii TaxID=2782701 RepID=UPI003D229ED1